MQLRVMSWNVHKGIGGMDRKYDLGRILEVVRHDQPDILLLQEVAQEMPRLRREDQVQLLVEETGYHQAFHPEHQFAKGRYGNLTLSRWPIRDVQRVDLKIGWRKQRGLILARTLVRYQGHQRTVVLVNMHLGLAGSERGRQLRRFLDSEPFRDVHPDTPIVLGGDLNDLWGSLGPKFLTPAGFHRAGPRHNTFPAAIPLRPLDALFSRGAIEALSCSVSLSPLARAASDHLPLLADFRVWLGSGS